MAHPAVTLGKAIEALLRESAEGAGGLPSTTPIGLTFFFNPDRRNISEEKLIVRIAGLEGAPNTRAKNARELTASILLLAPAKNSEDIEHRLNFAHLVEQVITAPEKRGLDEFRLVRWEIPTLFDYDQLRSSNLCSMEMLFFYQIIS